MKKRIAAFVMLLPLVVSSARAASPGKTGLSFLNTSPYARSAALADATSAYVGDVIPLYSNPAGLAHLPERKASIHHASRYSDVAFSNLSFVSPHARGGWGVNVGHLTVNDMVGTRFDASSPDRFVETNSIDAGDRMATFAMAFRQNKNLAWGGSVKLVQETLDTESALFFLGDLGVIYRDRRSPHLRFAAVAQNMGPSGKFVSESVAPPTRMRGGVYWAPERWADWSAEAVYRLDGVTELLAGGELNWQNMGFLRFGYRYKSPSTDLGALAGLTAGVGLLTRGFTFDYAFQPFGDFGDVHILSLGWRFGDKEK